MKPLNHVFLSKKSTRFTPSDCCWRTSQSLPDALYRWVYARATFVLCDRDSPPHSSYEILRWSDACTACTTSSSVRYGNAARCRRWGDNDVPVTCKSTGHWGIASHTTFTRLIGGFVAGCSRSSILAKLICSRCAMISPLIRLCSCGRWSSLGARAHPEE